MKHRIRFRVHPSFVIFSVALVILEHSALCLIPLAAAACHELGHFAAMLAVGCPIHKFELTLFGAEIRTTQCKSTAATVAVMASGAAANILSAWTVSLLPQTLASELFRISSIALAAVNLLPIRTLDGGCILETVMERIAPIRAYGICTAVSALSLTILWLAAVYALLMLGGNLSLMLFCMYLFATLFLKR